MASKDAGRSARLPSTEPAAGWHRLSVPARRWQHRHRPYRSVRPAAARDVARHDPAARSRASNTRSRSSDTREPVFEGRRRVSEAQRRGREARRRVSGRESAGIFRRIRGSEVRRWVSGIQRRVSEARSRTGEVRESLSEMRERVFEGRLRILESRGMPTRPGLSEILCARRSVPAIWARRAWAVSPAPSSAGASASGRCTSAARARRCRRG